MAEKSVFGIKKLMRGKGELPVRFDRSLKSRFVRTLVSVLVWVIIATLSPQAARTQDRPDANTTPPSEPERTLPKSSKASRPPLLDGLATSLPAVLDRLGAFTTSVPVRVPAFRGLEPDLHFGYQSDAGDGIMGVGWALSVPSVVQRLGRALGVPAYNQNDVFYLDGLELVPCKSFTVRPNSRTRANPNAAIVLPSPGCRFPAAGNPGYQYYFTKRETYRRIAFDTQRGYWHVWRTDGVRLDYELAWLTGVHRLPNRWMLTSATDALGNTVTYEYQSCNVPLIRTRDPLLWTSALSNLLGEPRYVVNPINGINDPRVSVAPYQSQQADLPPELERLLRDPVSLGAQVLPIPGRVVFNQDNKPGSDVELATTAKKALDQRLTKGSGGGLGRAYYAPADQRMASTIGDDPATQREVQLRLWSDPDWATARQVDVPVTAPSLQDRTWLQRDDRFNANLASDVTVEYVYPRRIRYGSSVIDFYLEPRPDVITFGIGDQTIAKMSCRLHSVDVQTADETGSLARVRTVLLDYTERPDTVRSMLTGVTEFGSDAKVDTAGNIANAATATSMPMTTFEAPKPGNVGVYSASTQTLAPGQRLPNRQLITEPQVSVLDGHQGPQSLAPLSLDFNGDGLTDQVFTYYRDPPTQDFHIYIQPYLAKPDGGFERLNPVATVGRKVTGGKPPIFASLEVGDIDGDGRQDIIWLYDFADPSDPHKFLNVHVAVTRFDDINGFETLLEFQLEWPVELEIATLEFDGGVPHPRLWRDPVRFFVHDIDGDGLDDILLVTNVSGIPDDETQCAKDRLACLDPVIQDRTWKLVTALSRGDGTFKRLPVVHTGWPIRSELLGRFKPEDPGLPGNKFEDAELFQEGVGDAEIGVRVFEPGAEDRFFMADINNDGKWDLIKVGNTGPHSNNARLELCTALPRTASPEEFPSALFELGCQHPLLPRLDNHEIYVPGDVDGDGRVDLVRVFEWYPGDGPHRRDFSDNNRVGVFPIHFVEVDNGQVAFQALLSDGRSFIPRSVSQTSLRWPRNFRFGADWRTEYWNNLNYFLSGWACTDLDGDGRCDMALFQYPYLPQFSDVDNFLERFRNRVVREYNDDPTISLISALSAPAGDGGDVSFSVPVDQFGGKRPPSSNASDVRLVDHNGDGRTDVVNWTLEGGSVEGGVRTYSWTTRVLLGGDSNADVWRTVHADVNGDGLLDLVRVKGWQPTLVVETWLRKADGTLEQKDVWQSSTWDTTDGRARDFQVGDLNRDGRQDLVLARYLPSVDQVEARVLLSNGDGTYDEVISQPSVFVPRLYSNRSGFRIADIDGDGRADLIHLTSISGARCPTLEIGILRSKGDGTFDSTLKHVDLCGVPGQSAALRVADVNGDGRSDLIGVWGRPDGTSIAYSVLSVGTEWVTVRSELANLGSIVGPTRWQTVDLNADRLTDLEVLVAEERDGSYDLWLLRLRSNGDGTWNTSRSRAVSLFPTADTLAWISADVNGDGRSDFVHARFQDGGAVRIDTLVTTSGQKPLRKAWTSAPGTASSPDVTNLRPVDLGNGLAALEHPTYAPLKSSARIELFRPDVGLDEIVKAKDGLGGDTSVVYSSTAALGLSDAIKRCILPAASTFQVVTGIMRTDGRGGSFSISNYKHQCPIWSFNERRALGFQSVTEDQPPVVNRPARSIYRSFILSEACGAQAQLVATRDGLTQTRSSLMKYVPAGKSPPFHCERSELYTGEQASDGSSALAYTRYFYDAFGNPETTVEYGDSATAGDERRTHQLFSLLGNSFRVVEDGIDIFDAAAGGQLISSTRFCYDQHDFAGSARSCGHVPTDAGQLRLQSVWDDHLDQWYTTTFEHDTFGNVTKVTDANHHTIHTDWDAVHHLFPIRVINAKGQIDKTDWDMVHARPRRQIDVNGVTITDSIYDPLGRISSVQTADGGLTQYSYLDWGDPTLQRVVKQVKDKNRWLSTTSKFDGFGRVWMEGRQGDRDDNEYQRMWTYSDDSALPYQCSHWRDPTTDELQLETFTYDYFGRLIKVRHPDGQASTSEYYARRVVDFDERLDRHEIQIDAYARPVAIIEQRLRPSGAPDLYTTRLSYDMLGNLRSSTDGLGNRVTLSVDSIGRTWRMDDPDLGTIFYDRDSVGNLLQQTDSRGATINYAYDELNRLVKRKGSLRGASHTITWTHDGPGVPFGIGRLTSIQDEASPCARIRALAYDSMGRINSDTICVDGNDETMQFAYDPLGRLVTTTYPDGEKVIHNYDLSGRLSSIGAYADMMTYNADDQIVQARFGNGVTENRQYDRQRGWLTLQTVSAPNGFPYYYAKHMYLADGLPATSSEWLQSPDDDPEVRSSLIDRIYTYDSIHRLTDVTAAVNVKWVPGAPHTELGGGDLNEHFEYDAIGNLLTKTGVGSYAYGNDPTACATRNACGGGPHAVRNAGANWYSYDAKGNLIRAADGNTTRTFEYDELDQPRLYRRSGPNGNERVAFTYDPDGQRTKKEATDATGRKSVTAYFGRYVERLPSGERVKYYWAGDRLVARRDDAGVTWFVADRIASSRVITDEKGNVKEAYDYRAFGELTIGVPGRAAGRMYTGHIQDREVADSSRGAIVYMNARYYDPAIGRFLTADSITPDRLDPQSSNRYAYALNDPISRNDPDGHVPWATIGPAPEPTWLDATIHYRKAYDGDPYHYSRRAEEDRKWNDGIWKDVGVAFNLLTLVVSAQVETGVALSEASALRSGAVEARQLSVWELSPSYRGSIAEAKLATTEYQGWYNVGAERGGTAQLVDFQKGIKLAQLKTYDAVNLSVPNAINTFRGVIRDLANAGLRVNGQAARLHLDIRVPLSAPENTVKVLQDGLLKYGSERGVAVKVTPFDMSVDQSLFLRGP